MSKKNNENQNGATLGLGEISTIRNILMGQQINDFESRFKDMEKRLNKMEDNLLSKIQELKTVSQTSNKTIVKESNQALTQLEKRLEKEVAELERKVEKATNKERKELGKMLNDMSKRLLGV